MVEFAKSRGFLGYGVLPGGRNDKDSSHAVLPLAEYDELLRRIAVAERDKHEAIEQAKRTIGRERAAAEQRVREAEEAAQEQVTAMEEKLTRAEKEVNYQKGLNANLLRISRAVSYTHLDVYKRKKMIRPVSDLRNNFADI